MGTDVKVRLASRDQSVIDDLYARHRSRLFAIARQILGPGGEAEDVVQDVFTRLWLEPERFDPDRGTIGVYLAVATRGRALDTLRSTAARRARESTHGAQSARQSPLTVEELAEVARQRDLIRCALAVLPASERRPIELAYFSNLTYLQVAGVLAEPEGTIKSRIRAGLRRMAAMAGPDEAERSVQLAS